MSARCQVTGKVPRYGKQVSHSHRRTSRQWRPNLQRRTYWVPSERRKIRLRVSTEGIKIIDRDGIDAVIARRREAGERF